MLPCCRYSARLGFSQSTPATLSSKRSARVSNALICQRRTVVVDESSHGSSVAADRLAATKRWVESVVIGEKLCPFASPVLQNETLRIVASNAMNADDAVREVASEASILVGNGWDSSARGTRPESTLLVFDEAPFVTDFRDFVRLSWTLQSDAVMANGYADKLQLVLFHPRATHQTYSSLSDEESPGDYTIRSPFPTVHLLREEDVMQAVTGGYPNLESLPARNKAKMSSQGLGICKSRLEHCYRHVDTVR